MKKSVENKNHFRGLAKAKLLLLIPVLILLVSIASAFDDEGANDNLVNSVCDIYDCDDLSWTFDYDTFTRANADAMGNTEGRGIAWGETNDMDIVDGVATGQGGGDDRLTLTWTGLSGLDICIAFDFQVTAQGSGFGFTKAGATSKAYVAYFKWIGDVVHYFDGGDQTTSQRYDVGEWSAVEWELNATESKWRGWINGTIVTSPEYETAHSGWGEVNDMTLGGMDGANALIDNFLIFNCSFKQLASIADVTAPVITVFNTNATNSTKIGDTVNVSAIITETGGVAQTWLNVSYSINGTSINTTPANYISGDVYTHNFTIAQILGIDINFSICANDTSGNNACSDGLGFTVTTPNQIIQVSHH